MYSEEPVITGEHVNLALCFVRLLRQETRGKSKIEFRYESERKFGDLIPYFQTNESKKRRGRQELRNCDAFKSQK